MKILFITTADPNRQGDLLEVNTLNGLRKILGKECIDFPKKKSMYHDWSETSRETLHGYGFSMFTYPIEDIPEESRQNLDGLDAIIYGTVGQYGDPEYQHLNGLVDPENIWYMEGHDLFGYAPNMLDLNGSPIIGIQKKPCFKRELVYPEDGVYTTGLGIPSTSIREIDLSKKSQIFQSAIPNACLFLPETDLGNRSNYKFSDEREYHDDLARSWFGLTCRRGGWDALRHYEIIANGSVLLFRDYDKKPELCSPQNLPCFSYSSPEELDSIVNRLLIDGKPTSEYLDMLFSQREWLIKNATSEARALHILKTIAKNKK